MLHDVARRIASLSVHLVGMNSIAIGTLLTPFAWNGALGWSVVLAGFTGPTLLWVACVLHLRR